MFAVIKTGGKQYVVKEGDTLSVEKLELPAGQKFLFDQVLLVDDGTDTAIGTPVLEQAVVKAEVVRNYKDDKILVFKKKRRKQYRRTHGHRQNLTEVKIEKIYPDTSAVPAGELKFEVLAPVVAEKPESAPVPAPKPRAPKEAAPVEAKAPAKPAKGKAKPAAKSAAKPAPKKPVSAKLKSPAKKTAK
jgi:large subunit ribosomal protein L21